MTVCTRCVMDDSVDENITFDAEGRCNYCSSALKRKEHTYFPNEEGNRRIETMISMLKEEGKGKEYDCLMGLSGGLDSSYLAYLGAARWGLRIIGVHIDDGYDTEISKSNLDKLVDKSGITYEVIQPDGEQFNALTLAYMRAGVPDLAVPQDNVLFAAIYDFAKENNIKYFLSGSNFSTESILQKGCGWSAFDIVNLKDIHKKYGDKPIDHLHFISNAEKVKISKLLGIKTLTPLDYVDYTREKAFKELYDYCGFEYYGRKHLENHLTAFLQTCWLPEKFDTDKRKSHLSSLIVSGQMTRDEALKELEEPQYDADYMESVKDMMAENMDVSKEEINGLLKARPRRHDEFKIDGINKVAGKLYRLATNK